MSIPSGRVGDPKAGLVGGHDLVGVDPLAGRTGGAAKPASATAFRADRSSAFVGLESITSRTAVLTYDPTTDTLHLIDKVNDTIFTVDPATGAVTAVGPLGAGIINANGLAFVPAVPEPGSLALMGMGTLGLVGCRMRRRKVKATA